MKKGCRDSSLAPFLFVARSFHGPLGKSTLLVAYNSRSQVILGDLPVSQFLSGSVSHGGTLGVGVGSDMPGDIEVCSVAD